MDKYVCIIIYNYIGVDDLIIMKDIEYVNHPLVWDRIVTYGCLNNLIQLKIFPIQKLDFRFSNITNTALKHIQHMNVQELDLSWTNISDLSLTHMYNVFSNNKLHTLNLRRTQISDLSVLRGANLKKLDVSSTNITDASLFYIRNMNLQVLNLHDTGITDASIPYINPTDLQALNIGATHTDIHKWKTAFPNTAIYCGIRGYQYA